MVYDSKVFINVGPHNVDCCTSLGLWLTHTSSSHQNHALVAHKLTGQTQHQRAREGSTCGPPKCIAPLRSVGRPLLPSPTPGATAPCTMTQRQSMTSTIEGRVLCSHMRGSNHNTHGFKRACRRLIASKGDVGAITCWPPKFTAPLRFVGRPAPLPPDAKGPENEGCGPPAATGIPSRRPASESKAATWTDCSPLCR